MVAIINRLTFWMMDELKMTDLGGILRHSVIVIVIGRGRRSI
jgi:hypothetical protein